MADNQEEKIKRIFQDAGFNMTEAAEKLEISRGTLYNKINKHPLDAGFVQEVKQKLSINLNNFTLLDKKTPDHNDQANVEALQKEVERLKQEVLDLHRELREIYKKK